MKRDIAALITLSLIATVGLRNTAAGAGIGHNESGVMQFNEPVKLHDVVLQGEYLFVHHQGMMERGLPCTFVFRHDQGKPGGLVTSFRCRLVVRETAGQFKVTLSGKGTSDLPVIVEIQFAGRNEGHAVDH